MRNQDSWYETRPELPRRPLFWAAFAGVILAAVALGLYECSRREPEMRPRVTPYSNVSDP